MFFLRIPKLCAFFEEFLHCIFLGVCDIFTLIWTALELVSEKIKVLIPIHAKNGMDKRKFVFQISLRTSDFSLFLLLSNT